MIIPFAKQTNMFDIVSDVTAAAAFSLRRLRADYYGKCIRVRSSGTLTGNTTNTSAVITNITTSGLLVGSFVSGTGIAAGAYIVSIDSASQITISTAATADGVGVTFTFEHDIGFSGVYLDLSTLIAFVGSNSGYVSKWYDQSGNGNDATMATTTRQPRIVNAGTIDVESNGKPTLVFDGSNTVLTIANSSSVNITSQSLYISSVCKMEASAGTGYIVMKNNDTSATAQYGLVFDNTNARLEFYLEGNSANIARGAVNSFTRNIQTIQSVTWTNNTMQVYDDGSTSGTTDSYSGSLTNRDNMSIGARSNNAGGTAWATYFKGNISEVLILTSVTNRQKIEKNQGNYYSITVA